MHVYLDFNFVPRVDHQHKRQPTMGPSEQLSKALGMITFRLREPSDGSNNFPMHCPQGIGLLKHQLCATCRSPIGSIACGWTLIVAHFPIEAA